MHRQSPPVGRARRCRDRQCPCLYSGALGPLPDEGSDIVEPGWGCVQQVGEPCRAFGARPDFAADVGPLFRRQS